MNIRKEIDEARNRPANEQRQRDIGYKHGVAAAAGVLDGGGFNATTTHEYRLGDVVLCKLNQTKRDKPRRNTKCLQSPEDALAPGYALALALIVCTLVAWQQLRQPKLYQAQCSLVLEPKSYLLV